MTTVSMDFISRIALPCILFLSLTRAIPYLPTMVDVVYYGCFLSVFIWLVLRNGATLINTFLPFLLAIFLSLWVNDIPGYYRIWHRVLAFLSIVLTVGPFVINPVILLWRRLLFVYTLLAIRWVVIFSFVAWCMRWQRVNGISGFEGITNHSMLIGPLGGISLIYSIYRFYMSAKVSSRYKEVGIALISFAIMLLAGSRSAIASTFLGIIFLLSRIYRHRINSLIQVFFTFFLLLTVTVSIWWPLTERFRDKMERSVNSGSITSTRDTSWKDRLTEFEAFPIFGVGFATINTDYAKSSLVNTETGLIEPGSAWLFFLSSMGLVGFLSFFVPYIRFIYISYKKEETGMNGYFLGALLFMFFFHLFFEAHIVAGGAYFCFFPWLLLSECNRILNINNDK